MLSHRGCTCMFSFQCVFSYENQDHFWKQKLYHMSCTCTVLLQYGFSHDRQDHFWKQKLYHISCTCVVLSPVWVLLWYVKLKIPLNVLEHKLHLYGFTPVWVFS